MGVVFGKEGSYNKRKKFSAQLIDDVAASTLGVPTLVIEQNYFDRALWDVGADKGNTKVQPIVYAQTKKQAKAAAAELLEMRLPQEYGWGGPLVIPDNVITDLRQRYPLPPNWSPYR